MIYLDNAATTFPKPEYVYAEMDRVNREMGVNSGRGSYRLAQQASKLIIETKRKIREIVRADVSSAVVFTPSITIAINQVLNGISLESGGVVYVSPYEHNAVARSLHLIESRKKIVVKELPLDEKTLEIDIERLRYEFVKNKPNLVVCTHVSNVTGYILPVKDIFDEAKRYNCITVLDSAQSMGLIEIDSKSINADIICFAGHKSLYGPFGIGGYINVTNIPLDVYLAGGTGSDSLNLDMPKDSESRYEPASSNIVAIAGLNAALSALNINELQMKEMELTKYTVNQLSTLNRIKKIYTYPDGKQIGIVSFVVEDYISEEIGTILDEDFDIAVRTGYHCAPYIHKYLRDERSLGTVRIGIGQYNTVNDIDALINGLTDLLDS